MGIVSKLSCIFFPRTSLSPWYPIGSNNQNILEGSQFLLLIKMTASQNLHLPGFAVECGIVLVAATQLLTRHGMAYCYEEISEKKVDHSDQYKEGF